MFFFTEMTRFAEIKSKIVSLSRNDQTVPEPIALAPWILLRAQYISFFSNFISHLHYNNSSDHRSFFVGSLHLKSGQGLIEERIRLAQVSAYMYHLENEKIEPPHHKPFLVLGADINADLNSSVANFLKTGKWSGLVGLSKESQNLAHQFQLSHIYDGPHFSHLEPRKWIDYIWYPKKQLQLLQCLILPKDIQGDTFSTGFPSDHPLLFAEFEMLHV